MVGMMGNGPSGMMGGGMMGGYTSYAWVFQLFILLLLLLILWWLLQGQKGQARRDEHPMEIVQRRYAAGEITRKEYEQLRKDLK